MSPMDRLLAEAIPTRPDRARWVPWTPEEQNAHWKALCAAVGTPDTQRPTPDLKDAQTATQAACNPTATPPEYPVPPAATHQQTNPPN